jgi:murein DD-endopeptidase MepM/ murein hydrolase activator NlpD
LVSPPTYPRCYLGRPIRGRRLLGLLLGLGLVVCLGLGLVGSQAAIASSPPATINRSTLITQAQPSLEDLQQQRQQLEQQRRQLTEEQQRLLNQQQQAEQELGGLQDNIQTTASQIRDTEARLQSAENQLTDLQTQLDQAEADYRDVQSATVARLQFLQRQQGSKGWAVLLQSQNLNEFIDRRRQLKLVYAADRQVLEDLKAQADELMNQRAEVERQKNQVALVRQELLMQKRQFEAQADQQTQLIGRLKQDRNALEAAEAQLARDSENVANLIRQRVAAEAARGGNVRGTGQMIHPVVAPLTSGFGTRVHPILGTRRFHAGIDFGASHGTTIRAADSGRVILAGWSGGYGRTVIIDHGGGLSTLYAHCSQLFVSNGQSVSQGQAIAAVGSTGLSTGPHLHFEVRRNGNPVNPMGFL